MGRAADAAGIQFRMLNRSKGPAVRGPRAQADRKLYRQAVQRLLAEQPGLTIASDGVEDILIGEAGAVVGVLTASGMIHLAAAVIVTTGTFLRGLIHIGESRTPAGRVGEAPSLGLSKTLNRLGFPVGRLKTGTPPRLDGRTIDWDGLEAQPGDDPPSPFSYLTDRITTPQVNCHITWTSGATHEVIRRNLHRSPMYSGQIESTGPRYCPSVEDKIVRFADKERHQIFLEPEGLDDGTIYPNGISTSLPAEVQLEILATIPGLERARMLRPGYAIEYDFVDPRELRPSLETRRIPGLAQGLIAGINAALAASGAARPFLLDRSDAYIGVMIDDLVTRGTSEPYRMFTSRAEYRLTLRADNADLRLTQKGVDAGVVGAPRHQAFTRRKQEIDAARALAASQIATPNTLKNKGIPINLDGIRRTALDLLGYPGMSFAAIAELWPDLHSIPTHAGEQLEIEARYAGYLGRQEADIRAFQRDENLLLPEDLDYDGMPNLSAEIRSKLKAARPATLGAAGRISGVTPAAINALLRHVRRHDERLSA
jgi:tRNA uridine 5-carboxymethylaminomethyl modification enzyme